jgi:glycosyltransferase involved in cell wall biosynthesis
LQELADTRVKFLGFVYGQAARQLYANSYIYVQPSIMEGNSPSLMSAMACGRCTVVSGIEQNLETIGDAGVAFTPGDAFHLGQVLSDLLRNPDRIKSLGRQARFRIEQVYNWDAVVDQLERLYMKVVSS